MSFSLLLCGDVMTGRGIDQIFKYKNDFTLYEFFVKDARYYIPKEMKKYIEENKFVPYNYIWGDLLQISLFINSNLKIINLETSITTSNKPQNKEVLYKMHPKNIQVIKEANIDYCHMANNHVLDWGEEGLKETINTLNKSSINFGGIGNNILEASKPKIFIINNKRLLIFSYGDVDSGIPKNWEASDNKSGINLIETGDKKTKFTVRDHINKYYKKGDFIIVSIHWGGNWGFDVEHYHEEFAHYLIDNAHIDIIHGHSSHHFRPIEIYKNKLILYSCGDMITDYEIIDSHDQEIYLSNISLAYFPQYENGKLENLILIPFTVKNMRLVKISEDNFQVIIDKLNEICQKYKLCFRQNNSQIILCNGMKNLKLMSGGMNINYDKYLNYKKKYLDNKRKYLEYKM